MTNYIPDKNPFKLAGPPKWWQQRLYNFDPSLVLLPSRVNFVYRLGQRQPVTLSASLVNDLHDDSDTKMLASYGLIPVTTLIATVNWDNPTMWVDLARQAPWRQGGAAKVIKRLEDQDEARHQRLILDQKDMTSILAKDSWKLFRKKVGLGRTWHQAALDPQYS